MKDLVLDKLRHQLVVRSALQVMNRDYRDVMTPARKADMDELLELVEGIVKDNSAPPMSLEETRGAIRQLEEVLEAP